MSDTRRGVERGTEAAPSTGRTSFDIRASIDGMRRRSGEAERRPSSDIQRGLAELKIREDEKISKHEKKVKRTGKGGVDDLKAELVYTEHLDSLVDLSKKNPESNIDPNDPENSGGLSSEAAKKRLELNGLNRLTPPKGTSLWIVFGKNFTGFFPLLMEAAGVLCLIAFFISLGQSLSAKYVILYALTF